MPHSRSSKTVLVVDDEPAVASVIRETLVHFGYQVTCVLDAKLALDRIGKSPYDVIVTDMLMPDIDGAQVIREARRLGSRAHIVAISGGGAYMGPEEMLAMAAKIGASAVLQKPFTAEQLLMAVGAKS
jgi:CheY-like chemotaxis protein